MTKSTYPNEKQMESARHIMALDGYLHERRNSTEASEFENLIEKETLKIASSLPESIVNSEKAYGIKKEDMKCFKRKQPGNYTALEKIVIGLKNCDVPHKILRELNSSEIIGLYVGIGQLKDWGRLQSGNNDVRYKEFMEKEFTSQISLLISYGYRYDGIRIMRNRGFKSHPNKPGQLKERMECIDNTTRKQLVDNLSKPSIKSKRYDSINGFDDPNAEGLKDQTAKIIYIGHIASLLNYIQKKNTKNYQNR